MLSLVASTAGQRVTTPTEFWGGQESSIAEAWNIARSSEASRHTINQITAPLRKWAGAFLDRLTDEAQAVADVMKEIRPPDTNNRFPTIESVERHIRKKLRLIVPPHILDHVRQNFANYKGGLDKRSRRLLMSEEGRCLKRERSLIESCATLIVVPDALLEHWFQQIYMHLDLSVFAPGVSHHATNGVRGVVYLDGIGDMADVIQKEASLKHVNLSKPVAPHWELSQYLIVVTTFSRCELQYRNEVGSGRMDDGSKKRNLEAVQSSSVTSNSFLMMRWLRLVVDEGHELGNHPTGSGITRFVNQIAAERRWVLSGTPTTGNEDDKNFCNEALDQLHRLLFFLRHPEYGQGHIPETKKEIAACKWTNNVKRPFLARHPAGRAELLRVLKSIMVMHRKEDIDLPLPIFRQIQQAVHIPNETEDRLHKECGPGVRLVAAFDAYLHSSDFQSLVDQCQAEYILRTVSDARQVLKKTGERVFNDSNGRIVKDTRPIKAVVYSSDHNILLSVADFILRQLGIESVAELYESEKVGDINAELSRFRLGVKTRKICPICHREELDFKIMVNGSGCKNQLLEVVSVDGNYKRFLVEPERIVEPLNIPQSRMEGEPMSNYWKNQKFWGVGDHLRVDIRDPHPVLAERQPEQVWHDLYGSEKCKDRALIDGFLGQDWYFGTLPEETDENEGYIMEVVLKKWQQCGKFHSPSRWYSGPRLRDQPLEKVAQDVFLLTLDASLSHGLDLSFVTHIFMLEPIDDAALLEQVTSRAHRIGALGPVLVETIHTHYQVSEYFSRALTAGSLDIQRITQDKQHALHKVVCEHCYRSFASHKDAEEHERTNCPRNPENVLVVDSFHLSSVYREIKPPGAVKAKGDKNTPAGTLLTTST